MKPPPFEYHAPDTREQALALMAHYGGEARVLAGGQSLVPAMNFRLVAPSVLVDLNRVADLFGIEQSEDGRLHIRAMTRQRTVEHSPLVAGAAPLIAEAMPHIAHPQIRNRGTFGGSLAHADPAAELPAVVLALDGLLKVQRQAGSEGGGTIAERIVPASDFFLGMFTTALEPDEILVEAILPPLPPRTGTAFEEFARRHGDYALAGACAVVTLEAGYPPGGVVRDARLVLFAVGDMPVRSTSAEGMLRGQVPSVEAISAAAEAATNDIDPHTDIHATAAYRRHLVRVLAKRALVRAVQRAQEQM